MDKIQHLKCVATYHEGYGRDISFSSTGQMWATATTGTVHLWEGSRLLQTIDIPGYVHGSIRFSHDNNHVYVGAWQISTSLFEKKMMLPNTKILVSAIDPEDNPQSKQFSIHHAEWSADTKKLVIQTMFQPSRERNVSDDYDGPESQALLLDPSIPALISELEVDSEFLSDRGIAVSPRWIATGGEDVDVWDVNTGEAIQILESEIFCQFVCFSMDENYLASTHNDGMVYLWDTQNWLDNIAWQAHEKMTRGVAFHPKLPLLASFSDDPVVKLWSLEASKPEQIAHVIMERNIEGLTFNPDGSQLYITASYPAPAISIYDIS